MRFQETRSYRGIMPHLYANYNNDFVEEFTTLYAIDNAPRPLQ